MVNKSQADNRFSKKDKIGLLVLITVLAAATLLYLFGPWRGPHQPAMDISGLPRVSEEAMCVEIDGISYRSYAQIYGDKLTVREVLGYEMIAGSFYKFYASVKELSSEEWIVEVGNVNVRERSLYGLEMTLLKAEGTKEVPPFVEQLKQQYFDRQKETLPTE